MLLPTNVSGADNSSSYTDDGVFVRYDPRKGAAPVLFEVPQSGTTYPNDFDSPLPGSDLHLLISPYVEHLLAGVTGEGCTLLHASFPMTYINANRSPLDLDDSMLSEPWPSAEPSPKVEIGIGLIQKWVSHGVPIYDRLLTPSEIRERIGTYYDPYHAEIARILSGFSEGFGRAYHLDCHCMGSVGSPMSPDPGKRRADFCVGDRDGTTCSREFRDCVVDLIRGMGFSVSINDPFKGVEIIRRHGDPTNNVHSLQLEIGRGLFLDENTNEPSPDFEFVAECLRKLAGGVRKFATETSPA